MGKKIIPYAERDGASYFHNGQLYYVYPYEKANRNAANGSTDTLSTQFDRLLDHYEIKHEDTPAFTRIHIYDAENRKVGLVKITKPDNKMTFKVPGDPAVRELASAEDINKYL